MDIKHENKNKMKVAEMRMLKWGCVVWLGWIELEINILEEV